MKKWKRIVIFCSLSFVRFICFLFLLATIRVAIKISIMTSFVTSHMELYQEVVEKLLQSSKLPVFERCLLQQLVNRTSSSSDSSSILTNFLNLPHFAHTLQQISSHDEKLTLIQSYVIKNLSQAGLELMLKLYQEVYASLPTEYAKKLAKQLPPVHEQDDEESKTKETDITNTILSGAVYGEIEFGSFVNIIQRCRPLDLFSSEPDRKKIFIDLGHGTGKALVATSLLYGNAFERIHGIEYAPGLHEESLRRIATYQDIISNHEFYQELFSSSSNDRGLSSCMITAEEGDFLTTITPSDDDNSLPQLMCFDWTTAGEYPVIDCYFLTLCSTYDLTQSFLSPHRYCICQFHMFQL